MDVVIQKISTAPTDATAILLAFRNAPLMESIKSCRRLPRDDSANLIVECYDRLVVSNHLFTELLPSCAARNTVYD
jgi:hypothetical protein